jgi:hypothetical protein
MDWFTDFADWILDLVLWLPRKLFEIVLDALSRVIEAIPVPNFINEASLNLSGISEGVAWTAGVIELEYGITVVIAASVLRFIVRRLPIIG